MPIAVGEQLKWRAENAAKVNGESFSAQVGDIRAGGDDSKRRPRTATIATKVESILFGG